MTKKLIDLNETQLLSLAIKENLKHKDYKMLEASADLGMKRFPQTKHYNAKLKRAYLTLADHYESQGAYYEYTKALRKALHVAPGNGAIVDKQIFALNLILENYGQDYIKKDLGYLEFVVQLLRLKYNKGKYSKKVLAQANRIFSTIEMLRVKSAEGVESKHTFQIKQLLEPFTLGFTKEQREGIVETLSPIMPDLIKEWEKMQEAKETGKEKDK